MRLTIIRYGKWLLAILAIGVLIVIVTNGILWLASLGTIWRAVAIFFPVVIGYGLLTRYNVLNAGYRRWNRSHFEYFYSPRIGHRPPGCLLILLFILTPAILSLVRVRHFILTHAFPLSFLLVFVFFQFTLRRKTLNKQTWKRLTDIWLKWSGVSAVTAGGFEFIATNPSIKNTIVAMTTASPIANIKLMTGFFELTVLVTFFAGILTTIGRIMTDSEESNEPLSWFVPAFIFSWISLTISASLVLYSIILTIHAHLG